ncbi:MAG TPA: YetF domain-containing protein [Mucilaginibacter sp.]|nr:YetF domain-containing protein [Mucilaginibacter sp.]
MDTLIKIFGEGKDLNALQMSCRGVAVLLIALILIRISGRRSFGLHTPLDNIVTISLGAILSRAVVGASSFVPVITTCFVIVILHRVLGWLVSRSRRFGNIVEGKKILLFSDGNFNRKNIRKALVCEEDVMQGVRESALTDDMSKIDRVYMERNGQISAVKKTQS